MRNVNRFRRYIPTYLPPFQVGSVPYLADSKAEKGIPVPGSYVIPTKKEVHQTGNQCFGSVYVFVRIRNQVLFLEYGSGSILLFKTDTDPGKKKRQLQKKFWEICFSTRKVGRYFI